MQGHEFGRYITSKEFSDRVGDVVEEAVRDLEAKGIKPAYGKRRFDIRLPDPAVQDVLTELFERGQHAELREQLAAFAQSGAGARQVIDTTVGVASALLLAKTAMPAEETKFAASVGRQMAQLRSPPVLVDLALLLIDGERKTVGDIFRDRSIITDALFEQRIQTIEHALRH
jgi:hypothetical protein